MQGHAAMAAVAELTSIGSNLHSKMNLFNSSNACDHMVMESILTSKYTVSMYVCIIIILSYIRQHLCGG